MSNMFQKRTIKALPVGAASLPTLTERDVITIKQLLRGDADKDAQIHAVNFIVKKLCGIGSLSFSSDNPHITSFNEGKRVIASHLLFIAESAIETLVDKK